MRTGLRYLVGLMFTVAVLSEILLQAMYSGTTGKFTVSPVPESTGFCIVDPNIVFDPVMGYRFRHGSNARYTYFVDGEHEIDFVMKVNNRGLPSQIDFHAKKDAVSIRRFLVFGDSFSAGVLMDTTWVDHVNMAAQELGSPVELHNYSVDGGGIRNWYNIYRNEIGGDYEYDGVILALYIDNLNRHFVSWWDDGQCVRGNYFDVMNLHHLDERDGMCCFQTFSSKDFSGIEESHFSERLVKARSFPLAYALLEGRLQWGDPYERGQRKYYGQYIDRGPHLPFHRLDERYNAINLAILDTMINELRDSGKEIVLAIIPDRYISGSKRSDTDFTALYELDIQAIADHYDIAHVFNGNDAFSRFSPEELQSMWLTGDLHWNAHGARQFARDFAACIQQTDPVRDSFQRALGP